MCVQLCVLLFAACVMGENPNNNKFPFVADAVGNTLPPPSKVPAMVGSPVNLLTPDKYEFYTFDESGELVKRLMTLEEIQAIVASSEETEGLVTFSNESEPPISLNFSQPPNAKVESVVTNVKNLVEALNKEAPKNQLPQIIEMPVVYDSWNSIIPSFYKNDSSDISHSKNSIAELEETELILTDQDRFVEDKIETKEDNNNIRNQNIEKEQLHKVTVAPASITAESGTITKMTRSTTTTTITPINLITKKLPSTTTTPLKSTTTDNTFKPSTVTKTTNKPLTDAKINIKLGTTKTTNASITTASDVNPTTPTTPTTIKISTTTKTVSHKPTTTTKANSIITTSTSRPHTLTLKTTKGNLTTPKVNTVTTEPYLAISQGVTNVLEISTKKLSIASSTTSTTPSVDLEENDIRFEKISTIPHSTAAYITERVTHKPTQSNNLFMMNINPTDEFLPVKEVLTTSTIVSTTTTSMPTRAPVNSSLNLETQKFENIDLNTSTSFSTTSIENKTSEDVKAEETMVPLFDVAQSISQIASDLSGNFQPIPTTSNLDTTKLNDIDLESKENLEIDIPVDTKGDSANELVKISTLYPHSQKYSNITTEIPVPVTENQIKYTVKTDVENNITTALPLRTKIDTILSDSIEDSLSQVVQPVPQSIIDDSKKIQNDIKINTTGVEKISNISTSLEYPLGVIKETLLVVNTTTLTPDTKEEKNVTPSSLQVQEKSTVLPTTTKITEIILSVTPTVSMMEHNDVSKNLENATHITIISINDSTTPNILTHSDANSTDSMKVSEMISTTESHQLVQVSSPRYNSLENINVNSEEENDQVNSNKKPTKVEEFKKKIQKVNIDEEEHENERNSSWKLISTVSPPKIIQISNDKVENHFVTDKEYNKNINLDFSQENQGLEITTKNLGEDIIEFTNLCNELAFRYWSAVVEKIDKKRSFVLSPYSITSMLAMMFMGAKGATSGEMNEILKLDDMVTFNPHFTLKNISDSIEANPETGIAVSAFVRILYSDRNKGKILTFYKERAQHFYNGHVEEVNFKLISDIIRRRTNLLVKRYTSGKIVEYMKTNSIVLQPPLAAFSVNIFQTDCTGTSVEGRDGEMYFVVSPNVRQRRLVPVPAVVYRKNFIAGYDPVLDATAAALGSTDSVISTLFLMPGQQGNVVNAEDLEALEKRLLDSNPTTPTWNRLLRTLLPRIGLELQIPRFSHKSIFNISSTLRRMGLKDLFDSEHADLGGLSGPSKDLYLSDMIQASTFVTCGESVIADQHHIEEYPETMELTRRRRTSRWAPGWDEPRDYQRAFHDPHDVGDAMNLPLHLRPRQARVPARNVQLARLKFDRPFLYFVRHNPSGMILYVGRYNPRLLP